MQGTWVQSWSGKTLQDAEQLSPGVAPTEPRCPKYWSPHTPEALVPSKRSQHSEKCARCSEEEPLLATTRQSSCAPVKTQHSRKSINKPKKQTNKQKPSCNVTIFIVIPALIFVHVLGIYKDFLHFAIWGDFKPHIDFVFEGIYASAILGGQLQLPVSQLVFTCPFRQATAVPSGRRTPSPTSWGRWVSAQSGISRAPSLPLGNSPPQGGLGTTRSEVPFEWALYCGPESCHPGQPRVWEVRVLKPVLGTDAARALCERLPACTRSHFGLVWPSQFPVLKPFKWKHWEWLVSLTTSFLVLRPCLSFLGLASQSPTDCRLEEQGFTVSQSGTWKSGMEVSKFGFFQGREGCSFSFFSPWCVNGHLLPVSLLSILLWVYPLPDFNFL